MGASEVQHQDGVVRAALLVAQEITVQIRKGVSKWQHNTNIVVVNCKELSNAVQAYLVQRHSSLSVALLWPVT